MLRKTVPAVLAALLLTSVAFAEPAAAPAKAPYIDRLARVGRLWGTVRYLHPYLAYREVDWDAALVAAIPKVREAKSTDEYRAAVQGMLDALGDPVTRMMEDAAPPAPKVSGEAPASVVHKLDGGVIQLDLTSAKDVRAVFRELEAAAPDVDQVSAVVVDLRTGGDYAAMNYAGILLDEVAGALVSRPCRAPAQRYLLHSGFQPHDGSSSGGYFSGFLTQFATAFQPRTTKPATRKRVVFVVEPKGLLPPLAVALQAVGDARLVSQGRLSEESLVSTTPVDLGEGLTALVRVGEIVPMPGWSGVHADVEVPEGDAEGALNAAVAEARKEWPQMPASSSILQPLPDPVFHPDRGYPEMQEPSLEYRQLAVIRAWNVIHYFYPYLHLIGDWDAVLPGFLARMEEAKTGKDYALTIAEMMTHVPDGHTNLWGHPALDERVGKAGLPISVRWIEGAPVVIEASDEAKSAGIEPGDALVAIDGEPVEAGLERLGRTFTASTPWAFRNRTIRLLLLGSEGSTAVLKLQKLDGSEREVSFVRDPKKMPPQPQGEIVRVLPGNIGYVDLPRLARGDVDAMFEKVKGTRGLILDMRGYPQGTAWSIAPRINTRDAKVGAQFRRSQVSAFSFEEGEAGFYFSQPIPPLPPGVEKYTAPTVMLIDDRAISQAEHSGLFYEAAAGTKFIGSPTAGANGDVTRFPLPGGIWVMFGGHEVRHADGRQLQRVGLQPDIAVEPTRKGVAAGRDEVLERAVQYLTDGK
ncbi:MAG TPA: S41 family peptidase [Thermoanaerobaculia bacterium]|jgi:C-terminal processing protease CtpA/Prc|nr:S41 family peptidase [Thermoanaerobaculia bacterium]